MNGLFSENVHIVKGIDPVANAFAGTVYSDVVSMKNYGKVAFLITKGVGTTGTSTVTVQACDDTVPTTRSALPFKYRVCTADDDWGDLTAVANTGFVTTAGSSQRYLIEVDAKALASLGYEFIQLKMVESVDADVLGGVDIFLLEPRYPSSDLEQAIS